MGFSDDYILGNSALHERFRLATEILGILASSAPRSVTMTQLEERTGRPRKELIRLCAVLWRAALMRPDANLRDGWVFPGQTSALTLEDVFRCVLEIQPARDKAAPVKPANSGRTQHDVDLLMMQATMAVNQSVFLHLRQFSLDRLKSRDDGMSAFDGRYRRSRLGNTADAVLID